MNMMKNQTIQKFQSFQILKERARRQIKDFFLPLGRKIMFNGFKMFNFKCRSHVQKIILLENMFSCPLKLSLGFFGSFYIFGYKPKY